MRSPTSTWSLALLLLASCCTASAQEPASPRAWVLSPDPDASAAWLERVGFVVAPLPLGRSPLELEGLVVLASEASDMPEYHLYMQAHADALPTFVARGGVVLQLAQSAEAELEPPFLPASLFATRGPDAPDTDLTFRDHPLVSGLRSAAWRVDGDGFVVHTGFSAIVGHALGPATLLVGDHGRGQFVLTALPLDRPLAEGGEPSPLADDFADNLAHHVACVQAPAGAGCPPLDA